MVMRFRSGRRVTSTSLGENLTQTEESNKDKENDCSTNNNSTHVSGSGLSSKRSSTGKSSAPKRPPFVKREENLDIKPGCKDVPDQHYRDPGMLEESEGSKKLDDSSLTMEKPVKIKLEAPEPEDTGNNNGLIREESPSKSVSNERSTASSEPVQDTNTFTAEELNEALSNSNIKDLTAALESCASSLSSEDLDDLSTESEDSSRDDPPVRKKSKRDDDGMKANEQLEETLKPTLNSKSDDNQSAPEGDASTTTTTTNTACSTTTTTSRPTTDGVREDNKSEKRKRGRPAKNCETDSKLKNKETKENSEEANGHCSIAVPTVKVPAEVAASKEDFDPKINTNEDGTSQSDTEIEDDEPRLGSLVIWDGNPHEPLFSKKVVKSGRFYIVNCGEPKSLSTCKKTIEITSAASCTCCASGCQSFGSNHGVITGETSKRVSRRRPKGPKKVQLVTKEEHHKILNSYIADKKYEPEIDEMKESHDSNLMWLLDFKVDSLFANQVDQNQGQQVQNNTSEAAPRRTRLQNKMGPSKQSQKNIQKQQQQQQQQQQMQQPMEEEQVVSFTVKGNPELVDDVAGYEMVDSNTMNSEIPKDQEQNPEFGIHLLQDDTIGNDQRQKRPYRMRKVPSKELQGEITCDSTGKPRCTYTDLIEKALLQSNGGLTVSEIYNWISSNYPYFQANDDRWKNSVRHNLSINPYFKKGDKARNGAGHLWIISEDGKGIRPPIRRKSGSDNILDAICIENGDVIPIRNETDRAISVILSEYAVASMQHHQHQNTNEEADSSPVTYIQIPNDMNLGQNEDNSSQVICYEDLPDGSYTIDVQDPNMQQEQMYTLSEYQDGNVIIVNPDESNKENMSEQILNEMVVSEFGVLTNEGNMVSNGRISAPPMESAPNYGNPAKRERMLNRSSSLPLSNPQVHQEMIMDNSALGLHEQHQQDLTLLNTISSVAESEPMDTIGVVSSSHSQDTQVIEIIGDHLFDAKELGMIYEYDSHGDPLYL